LAVDGDDHRRWVFGRRSKWKEASVKFEAFRLWRVISGPMLAAVAVLAICMPGMSARAQAQPVKAEQFAWQGEELYYSVEVNGAEAARASLRAGEVKNAKGVSYVPISAKAITHGFFAKSYPVDDNADTYVDPRSLRPIKADKIIREDGKERIYKVRYQPGQFTAEVTRVADKKEYHYKRAVPGEIHDGLSWLYELRTKPLKDGDVYDFYVYDGWKLSRLHIKVVGREKAWTQLKTFDAVKLDIEREVLTSRWNGTAKKRLAPALQVQQASYYFATIHLTDDEARMPVRVFVTSKMGDSDFKLIKYVEPTKKK